MKYIRMLAYAGGTVVPMAQLLFVNNFCNWIKNCLMSKLMIEKLQHFLNDAFQSYYDLFQVNWLVQIQRHLYKSS